MGGLRGGGGGGGEGGGARGGGGGVGEGSHIKYPFPAFQIRRFQLFSQAWFSNFSFLVSESDFPVDPAKSISVRQINWLRQGERRTTFILSLGRQKAVKRFWASVLRAGLHDPEHAHGLVHNLLGQFLRDLFRTMACNEVSWQRPLLLRVVRLSGK